MSRSCSLVIAHPDTLPDSVLIQTVHCTVQHTDHAFPWLTALYSLSWTGH